MKRLLLAFLCLAPVARGESGHERMLKLLREVAARTPDHHLYLSDAKAREMRAAFEAMPGDAPDLFRWEAHVKLGEEEQRLGRELEAIQHFEEALAILPKIEGDLAPEWVVRLYFRLGAAYLRYGETRNCALHNAAESCILPIRGSGVHVDRDPSRRAAGYFLEVLERAPEESDPYLTSLWLLNIAMMTVEGYPDDVPPSYLIPPERFTSSVDFPRFENVATRAGVDTFSLSGGVVVEDFDGDGYLDLLVSGYEPTEQLRLFASDGEGTFTDVTEAAGLSGLTGGLNMVQGDYDDDGDEDVYVLRGAWLGEAGQHPNSLLRNNGDGTFTDVTFETGLGERHLPTQTASWADYDGDADLDLYVGNETTEGLAAPCQLFENQGNGTFVDVAVAAGVTNDRFTKAVVFGDYDADGRPDLYVSNLYEDNRLYRNLGDGRFEDVALALGVTGPRASFPAWFWDFDNDGTLDIYVSSYEAIVKDLAAFYLGHRYEGELQRLYRGDGRGGFADVGAAAGLDQPNAPMGSNFGDLDGDGYLDFYLGTGYPPYFALMPNVLYWNRQGKRFDDVTMAGGFGHLQKGHAVAFADLDADGDQDLFEQMGGALAGDRYRDVLYENPGFGNHSLEIELVGVASTRSGAGARIRVRFEENGSSRDVYKTVNSGGSFGAGSVARQFVGLGRAKRIAEVEVLWPASGVHQAFENVPLDAHLVLVEGRPGYWVVPRGR